MASMVKLTKKLTTKQFVVSHLTLLIFGLIFLGGLFYILNIQYSSKKGFAQGPVTSTPKTLRIDLDQPDENSLFFDPQLTVSGTTGPNLEVLITTDSYDFVVKSDSTGKFSTSLNLDEGPNKITAVSFDTTGDSRSEERNVFYSKEKI